MLVLTRKVGERITIGGDIVVMVTEIRGDKIRLGIEAPKAVRITRPDARSAPAIEDTAHAPL